MLLDFAAVSVEDSVVLDLCPIDSEGFSGLDPDAIDSDAKIPVDAGLAATDAHEPTFPPYGWLDLDCPLAVDRDIRCVNLSDGDHWGELRVCFEGVGDLVRNPFQGGVRWQDQPKIPVPTIVLHGEGDGVTGPEGSANDARFFSGPYQPG